MNPSYCRIHVPKDEALRRVATWMQLPQIGPLTYTTPTEAVRLACDERGMWRGGAVFVSEVSDWTLLQDLSGCLGGIPAEEWLKLARKDDLVFAGYNDAIRYGQLVAVTGGSVVREFLDDANDPDSNVNVGQLECESVRFTSWIDIAEFVDADKLGFSDSGWLWVFGETPGNAEN